MKSTKWNKWKLSKQRFPTFEVKGDRKSNKRGALVIGRERAAAYLGTILGRERADAMKVTDTRGEWVFMEPKAA